MTSEVSAYLLIPEVGARPCLWDRNHEWYKDRQQISKNWREVCQALHENFDELNEEERRAFGSTVLKRWTNIRDSYRRHIRLQKSRRPGSLRLKKYVYQDQLRFLDQSVDDPLSESTDSVKAENHERSKPTSSVYSIATPESTSLPVFSTRSTEQCPPAKKAKTAEVETRVQTESKSSGQKDDSHLLFWKGIVPFLKDFSEDERIEFQMEVLKVIQIIRKKRVADPLMLCSERSMSSDGSCSPINFS